MSQMFSGAKAFKQNIRGWKLKTNVNLTNMFSGATAMIEEYTGTEGFGPTPTQTFFNYTPPPPIYSIAGSVTINYSQVQPQASNIDVSVNIIQVEREAALNDTSIGVYYIGVEYDINKHITLLKDPSGDIDDSWELQAFVIDSCKCHYGAITYKLPGTKKDEPISVKAGKITVGESANDFFDVFLNFTLDNKGTMNAIISISGEVTKYISEDITKAQYVCFEGFGETPVLTSTTADTLSATLTAADIYADSSPYNTILNTLKDKYDNTNVITEWKINISAIPHIENGSNVLTKHARAKKNITDKNVFSNG